MKPPLCTIPTYMSDARDLELALTCAQTLRETATLEPDILFVDDGSPEKDYVTALEGEGATHGFELHRKDENSGFARTVNVGLRRAQEEDRDVILVNADIEFFEPGWDERMRKQASEDGKGLASVVGGLLLYPNGTIQHAGVYFSLLHRWFDHIYKHGPAELPAAQEARVCPVTAALQFIRADCLQEIGVYDERFLLGWEDVDYCIRVWKAGRDVVYQPKVRAFHHESVFRGRGSEKLQRWQTQSWLYFAHKWASQSFTEFIPSLV